jgi:hypothetical protein
MSRYRTTPQAAAALEEAIKHLLRAEVAARAAVLAAREGDASNAPGAFASLAAQIERVARAAEAVAEAYPADVD